MDGPGEMERERERRFLVEDRRSWTQHDLAPRERQLDIGVVETGRLSLCSFLQPSFPFLELDALTRGGIKVGCPSSISLHAGPLFVLGSLFGPVQIFSLRDTDEHMATWGLHGSYLDISPGNHKDMQIHERIYYASP